jgi:hypothetical protein
LIQTIGPIFKGQYIKKNDCCSNTEFIWGETGPPFVTCEITIMPMLFTKILTLICALNSLSEKGDKEFTLDILHAITKQARYLSALENAQS